jgi:hypothetical protein
MEKEMPVLHSTYINILKTMVFKGVAACSKIRITNEPELKTREK